MRFTDTKIWIAVTLAACAILVICQLGEFRLAAIVSKVAASSGFLAVAASSGALRSKYGKLILAGLVFSAIGDVLLLGATQKLFLFGLVSFLLAHVIYVGAFVCWSINWRWFLAAAVPIAVASIGVSTWLSPYLGGDMRLPVHLYVLVISVMVIAAFGAKGAGGPALIPMGALLFYVSDLSVAAGRFVQPDFPNYVWGLPLYYVAQVLLALSVAAAAQGPETGAKAGV